MREGTEESTLAIHGEIARGPDRRSSYVACDNRVLRRELIEHPGDILRMDRLLPGIACGKFVQAVAGLSIVIQRFLQMMDILVLFQLRQKPPENSLRVANNPR